MVDLEKKRNAINSLLEKGKASSVLTYQEIMDALSEIELEPEQIEKVYEALEKEGIRIKSLAIEGEMLKIRTEKSSGR